MTKQVVIIGLGHFGMSVARALSDKGAEVLAVDIREDLVRTASSFVAEAVSFDATVSEALARTSPHRREACVCAIGDESKEASIICTALLAQMGAKRIIARANDVLHERILKLVGAHQVVNPEREFGESFASQIIHENLLGQLRLGENLVINEFQVPPLLVGHTLSDLKLPQQFQITVVALRRGDRRVHLPSATDIVKQGDNLIVVSRPGAVDRLLERS